jgi:translation initiation factor IF-1
MATNGFVVKGKILEIYPGGRISVHLENDTDMNCSIAGKLKRVHLLRGDNVEVEISPYDLTRGLIIKRLD